MMTDEDPLSEDRSSEEHARASLREVAEESLRRQQMSELPESLENMSPEAIKGKMHELQVHQIELEMQNIELRRVHADLDKAHSRYFELYNLAPVGYLTLSDKGQIKEANLTAADFLGVNRGVLVLQPFNGFIHSEDQDIFYLCHKQLVETGIPQDCELRVRNSVGSFFWVRLNINAATDELGNPSFRLVLIDISAHKAMEEEKRHMEAEYQQAQKMESVGRLAGGIAHDFNNKLTVILGFLEMVMDNTDPSDPSYADMEEIRRAGESSAELIQQLLAFARKELVAPKVHNLNDTVDSLLNMLKLLVGEAISISWVPGVDLSLVKIDPAQIDQILTNLCANAHDAIADIGEVVISTENVVVDQAHSAMLEVPPGGYVLLTVSDTGCGMKKETLEQIFEPFFTTKDVDKGTGLGLASVYGIVKQNNGHIIAESVPDLGTTYKIYLPQCEAETTSDVAKLAEQGPAEHHKVLGTQTILLVEDELMLRQVVMRILQLLGYEVLAADNPAQAISLARKHSQEINLILTDIVMPEMNGRMLAEKIGAFCPHLKVLYMSGYSFETVSEQELAGPGFHFIQKPFSQRELAAKIREVFEDDASVKDALLS